MSRLNIRKWAPRILIGVILLLGALALGGTAGPAQAQGAPPKPPQSASPSPLFPGGVVPVPGISVDDNIERMIAVSALGPDDVWAVGKVNSLGMRMFAQHWDGQSWSPLGPGDGAGYGILLGVTMVAHNDVWVVGTSHRIEHWDGVGWTLTPNPTQQDLNTIAAAGPNDVWAAGANITVHWDGTAWTNIPNPVGSGFISALTARASNDVWAVGGTSILHWDGTAWTQVLNPPGGSFFSVAAIAANDVWAAGYLPTADGGWKPGTEHWNGTTWSAVPLPPLPTIDTAITGISAAAANDVWVVGSGYNYSDTQNLVLHWDGSAWSVVPSVNADIDDNQLLAVSAPAPGVMWAVGVYRRLYHLYDTALAVRYNPTYVPPPPPCDGALHLVPSPSFQNVGTLLYGVSASSPSDAWAVGATSPDAGAVLTHWDGNNWRSATPPDNMALYAITTLAANDIWAVGDQIIHWDGKQWKRVNQPPVLTGPLRGVAAVAPNDVWAVGNQIIHWNGTVWSVVPSPATEPLRAVAVVNSSNIWGVGGTQIVHWDGSIWQSVSGPSGVLYDGIAVISPTDIWAVGSTTSTTTPHQRVVHWDGQGWTVDPSVDDYGTFFAVSARGSNDVWAAGSLNSTSPNHMYIELKHWNGRSWERLPVGWPGYNDHYNFYGVTLVPGASDVWTVGTSASGDSLIERVQPACSAPEKAHTP